MGVQTIQTYAQGPVAGIAIRRSDWQLRASCNGPESKFFFPPHYVERRDERDRRERRAKEICSTCVVRQECLDYALGIREQYGIWGGLSEMERRSVLAQEVG